MQVRRFSKVEKRLFAFSAAKLAAKSAVDDMNVKDYFTFMSKALDLLYDVAESQAGYFTTGQAERNDVSRQLIRHHEQAGAVRRVAHGIYRLNKFPAQPFEDVVIATLWAGDDAVASHETALAVHGLGDAMPSTIHLTVPGYFRGKRAGVAVHTDDIPTKERTTRNSVPVTTVERTLLDTSASDYLIAEVAMRDALTQGVTTLRRLQRAADNYPDNEPFARLLDEARR